MSETEPATAIPKIVVYETQEASTPHRFCGMFFVGGQNLPVIFFRPDRNALITTMRDFWVEEQAKLARKDANRAARAVRMRKGV